MWLIISQWQSLNFLIQINLNSKAIKEIVASQDWLRQLVDKEINILKKVSHENILQYFEFYSGKKKRTILKAWVF